MGRHREEPLKYEDLTYEIIGVCMEVHRELGPVHKEKVYHRAVACEFKEAGFNFEEEKKIPIIYKGEPVGFYQPDFVVDDKVVLEVKAVEFLPKNAEDQMYYYLKGTDYEVGLLVNFGTRKLDIRRRAY